LKLTYDNRKIKHTVSYQCKSRTYDRLVIKLKIILQKS